MKKIFLTIIFFLVFPFFVKAQEKIESYHVFMNVNRDASIFVSENILYDFNQNQKHGIYREVPYKYKTKIGYYNLGITDIEVVDENDRPYKFSVNKTGGDIRIKIGDPDETITGKHLYKILYKVDGAILFEDEFDEFYWNAIGGEWKVDINNPKTTIFFPEKMEASTIDAKCFTGVKGSTKKCEKIDDGFFATDVLNFETGAILSGENMTIKLDLPKNIIKEPSIVSRIIDFLLANWPAFMPIITLLLMFFIWRYKGKDPKGSGVIIAQYDPPFNLTPAQVGTVIDEKANSKDITAEIIELATRGYIKIKAIRKKVLIGESKDFSLEKTKDSSVGDLREFQLNLMDKLFKSGNSVELKSLKNSFYNELRKITNEVYKSTVKEGLFLSDPDRIRTKYILLGVVIILFLGIFSFEIPVIGSPIFSISGVLSGLIIVIFGQFMPAKTQKGVQAREHILGLKEYLRVAEQERMNFLYAPSKYPEYFERLLPYAIVLGVEKEWANKFDSIYDEKPKWYSDTTRGHFSARNLTDSLNNFTVAANSTLSSVPSSGSGGSGGSSGGGFGGGGGGSW